MKTKSWIEEFEDLTRNCKEGVQMSNQELVEKVIQRLGVKLKIDESVEKVVLLDNCAVETGWLDC